MSTKETRGRLLEATTALLAKKDLNFVSIREIAHAAGVNTATISYHFGGKNELVLSIIDEVTITKVNELLEKLTTDVFTKEAATQRLNTFLKDLANLYLEKKDLINAFFSIAEIGDKKLHPKVSSIFLNIQEKIMEFLRELQKNNVISTDANLEIRTFLFLSPILEVVRNERQPSTYFGFSTSESKFLDAIIPETTKRLLE